MNPSYRYLALVGVLVASPVFAADADNGERLARRWCSACHVVAADQRQASTDAPPFVTIARSPNFDSQKLFYFLIEPHPKMPNMALSRHEAEDIAAYIAGLMR